MSKVAGRETLRACRRSGPAWAFLTATLVFVLPTSGGAQSRGGDDRGTYCSATATFLFQACGNEVQDDYWKARAVCVNVSDHADRAECLADARVSRREGERLCNRQLKSRRAACRALGQHRYDADLDPALFDDPKKPTNPNPYFPLTLGNRWEYRGGTETNVVEVVDETTLIEGVTCIVVRDRVFKDGDLVEDTDDWYVPAKDGSVWYFGEKVKDYESFDGDDPRRPELVKIDGSFLFR